MKIVGFLSEKKFWVVKRLEGGEKRENKICLKIYHINPIKLKTRNFRKLPSCKTTREKYLWSTNFSREDFTRETVVKQSWKSLSEFCVFIFCPNLFHLASLQFITFDHFLSTHLILRSVPEIFDILIWWRSLCLFGHHTYS